ncbi:DNRLRE domain-containing protein [Niallia sp. FSL R7-0271]|uniref:DNRLRE domain-containing protein n=1 Tax=Niallia sp. FSL R7-0271 TaxID=2921678 RepID=UPI0030FCA9C7
MNNRYNEAYFKIIGGIRLFKRFILIILSITLVISILPSYAQANTGNEVVNSTDESTNISTDEIIENSEEIENERDEYSKTFINDEGQLTTEIYAEPIHTKVDGKWEEISTDIILNSKDELLETEITQLEAAYPTKISSKEQIKYSFGEHSLEFSNITASDGKESFTLQQQQNAETNENKVTYKNVLPGIDLRHVSLNKEVKEDWIINEYQGINEFNYVVNTDLYPKLEDDGSIRFYENKDSKEKVFILPSPMMEDSNVNNGLGNGVKSNQLHYEIETIDTNQYSIKLVVDKKWLESDERVFPVYIDPSVSVDAMGDSFVSSAYPNTNYNKEWDSVQGEYVLKVGKYDSTTGTNYAFIKFSLTNLKGAVVDSADLKTYVTHAYYATQKTGLWVDRVTGPWYANELTWNNKPGSAAITSTTVARDEWATFPVKATVQGWINGDYQNDGFKFHTNGNGQTYWKKLSSAETENVAKLVISYHYPTMKNPTVKATQTADGATTGYVDVSWPSMNGAKSYELQMYNGKSFETVYTGTGTSWSSKNKKMFPKSPYSTSSSYKLDGTGVELPVDPSAFYSAKSGTSTTRKEYGFKVKAIYENGSSPLSAEVKKAIPANLVDTPDMPTVKGYAYPETDVTNKEKGWLDIKWDAVAGAKGYKVLIYNGKDYESFNVGNVTSWSTKGQKIWPTSTEISAGKFALHHDKNGSELPIDPRQTYTNANDGYQSFKRYSIVVVAVSDLGETPRSVSNYGYIQLPTVKNISVSNEIVDDVNNRGILNIKWDKIDVAGGYIVEINDGSGYRSYDVGNVTSWSTLEDENGEVFRLFPNVDYLPMDPTPYYKKNGADSSLFSKKEYEVRVRAYTINDEIEPPSEKDKIDGPRGLSAASTSVYTSFVPNDELSGIEDYYTFGTHEIGNAEASVNVTTGNLNLNFKDHSIYTRRIEEFNFNRYYNSKSNQSSVLGKGWTFNGNEYFVKKDSNSSDFYYFDEDGTRHEFVYNPKTGTYTSPKGKYLQLKDVSVNSKAGFALADKEGFTKYFEANPTLPNSYRLSYYKDNNNNQIRFKYSEDNKLIEVLEVDENNNPILKSSLKFTYSGDLITMSSYNNRSVIYTYDDEKRLIKTTINANGTEKSITNLFDYNEDNNLTVYTDAKNNINTFSYEDNKLEVLTPQSDGNESVLTTYKYDKANNKYYQIDIEGNTTTYERDTVNNTFAVATVINDDETQSKVTYDENYNELTETDELGNSSVNKYDGNGNILTNTDKEGNITAFTYNDKNQVIEEISPDGIKTINQYSGYNLISTQIGDELKKYEYDKYGRQTKEIYQNNTAIIQTYDDANNKTIIKDINGNSTTTIFDDFGQVVKEFDGENRATGYKYDLLYPEIKTGVTDGNGNTTTYEYDNNGNITAVINPNDNRKTFKYNGNNQLLESVYPINANLTNKVINTYDETGNLKTVKMNSGTTKNYDYDDLYQIKNVSFKNKNGQDSLLITNGYDDLGNVTSVTLKNIITNSNIIEKQISYTATNLISNYNQGNYSTSNEYDASDRIKNKIINYNDTVKSLKINQQFEYDEIGKISSTISSLGSTPLFKNVYTYDSDQNKVVQNYNDGLVESTSLFNKSSKVNSIQYKINDSTLLQSLSYEYDNSGNILKEISKNNSVTYSYDGDDQLVKENFQNGTTNEYQYDNLGNRVKAIVKGKEIAYSYNEGNQIIEKNKIPYIYDTDGKLIKDDVFKYEYNDMGSLTKVSNLNNNEVARYEYDENGLRIKKLIGSKTIEYYYDNNKLAIEILKENNQIISYRYYQWDGNDEIITGMLIYNKKQDNTWETNKYLFLRNQRGDVISIIDSKGAEVGSYEYDAFGNIISLKGVIAEENSIRYANYYYDNETKHYYLKARYYNPIDGVFLTLDPEAGQVTDLTSQHGYIYAENNPNYFIDIDGRRGIRIYGGSRTKTKGLYIYPSFSTGKDGEDYIHMIFGGDPHKYFWTEVDGGGGRIIDVYANKVAHEVKVGYATKSSRHKLQVRKDAWLLKNEKKKVVYAYWHFLRSKKTGKCGASEPLRNYLKSKGIGFWVYSA